MYTHIYIYLEICIYNYIMYICELTCELTLFTEFRFNSQILFILRTLRLKSDRQTDRQIERQSDRQTDGQTDRQTDRQTDI